MRKELARKDINDLEIKEFNNQRVVTLKDIDEIHGRAEGTARKRLNDNKGKFTREEDYYFIKPGDVGASEIRTSEINNAGTYLITETGYLMLVKSFTDDLAWEVQRKLVKGYFKAKEFATSSEEIQELKQTVSEVSDYYRLPHKEKLNFNKRIKSKLGEEYTNLEVSDVKEYVFIALGIEKWEDLPFKERLNVLDLIDRRCNIIINTRINIFNWDKN